MFMAVVAQVTDRGLVMDHSLLAHLIWEDHNHPLTLIVTTLITTSHTVHGALAAMVLVTATVVQEVVKVWFVFMNSTVDINNNEGVSIDHGKSCNCKRHYWTTLRYLR